MVFVVLFGTAALIARPYLFAGLRLWASSTELSVSEATARTRTLPRPSRYENKQNNTDTHVGNCSRVSDNALCWCKALQESRSTAHFMRERLLREAEGAPWGCKGPRTPAALPCGVFLFGSSVRPSVRPWAGDPCGEQSTGYRSYTDASAPVVLCQNPHEDTPTHKQSFVRRCQEMFCSCAQHRSKNIFETCLACLSHERLGASRPSRLRRRGRT